VPRNLALEELILGSPLPPAFYLPALAPSLFLHSSPLFLPLFPAYASKITSETTSETVSDSSSG
jgi:hypothetical protein